MNDECDYRGVVDGLECRLSPGNRWASCDDFEPNSEKQGHCIYFKESHLCVLNMVKKKHLNFDIDKDFEL